MGVQLCEDAKNHSIAHAEWINAMACELHLNKAVKN